MHNTNEIWALFANAFKYLHNWKRESQILHYSVQHVDILFVGVLLIENLVVYIVSDVVAITMCVYDALLTKIFEQSLLFIVFFYLLIPVIIQQRLLSFTILPFFIPKFVLIFCLNLILLILHIYFIIH